MLSILGILGSVFLFIWFVGWGGACLLLPKALRQHQIWLAPWVGLLISDITAILLSRMGLGTDRSIYLIGLLGACLLAVAFQRKQISKPSWHVIDNYILIAMIVSTLLTLAPLIFYIHSPTTFSLGNLDPQNSAVIGDYLQHSSLKQVHPPVPLNLIDATTIANDQLVNAYALVRPGAWLIYSLFGSLVRAQTHQVFSISLSVFQAYYIALIGVFSWVFTRKLFVTAIALILSSLNPVLLYFVYQGFGAHIPMQGMVVFGFLLLGEIKNFSKMNTFLLAMVSSNLLTSYPEISLFFFAPAFLYISSQIVLDHSRLRLIYTFSCAGLFSFLIDPKGIINGIEFFFETYKTAHGWPHPWLSLLDMLGVTSSINTLQVLSYLNIPAFAILCLGTVRSRKRLLSISIFLFALVILTFLKFFRNDSYGYYKASGFSMFIIIVGFSSGINALIEICSVSARQLRIIRLCTIFVFLSLMCLSLQSIRNPNFVPGIGLRYVNEELEDISHIPETLLKGKYIYMNESDVWNQIWIIKFLKHRNITFMVHAPLYGDTWLSDSVSKSSVLIDSNTSEVIHYVDTVPSKVLWQNKRYRLRTLAPRNVSVKMDRGLNCPLVPIGSPCRVIDDVSFTVKYYGKDVEGIVDLNFDFQNSASIPKIDFYLNDELLNVYEKKTTSQRSFSIQVSLKKASNQLRLHFNESAIQKDKRNLPNEIVLQSVRVKQKIGI
jgi:hypothetical protein